MGGHTSEILNYVIYDNPADYPGLFVVRRHVIGRGTVQPTDWLRTGRTLEEVRAHVPPGLVCFARMLGDEPHIVEVWL